MPTYLLRGFKKIKMALRGLKLWYHTIHIYTKRVLLNKGYRVSNYITNFDKRKNKNRKSDSLNSLGSVDLTPCTRLCIIHQVIHRRRRYLSPRYKANTENHLGGVYVQENGHKKDIYTETTCSDIIDDITYQLDGTAHLQSMLVHTTNANTHV